MLARGSVREFSISSDINCLVGLEEGGGVHHQNSEFDYWFVLNELCCAKKKKNYL